MRWLLAVLLAGTLTCAGCSSPDDQARPTAPAAPSPQPGLTSPGTQATTTPTTTGAPAPADATTPPVPSVTAAVNSPLGGPLQPGPQPVDEWRLVVVSPQSDSQVQSPFLVSYEVSGPSRSADLILEVSLENPPGEGPDATPQRFTVEPGRGSVQFEAGKLSSGRHDLRVRLHAPNAALRDVVVQDLRIAGDRSTAG